MGGSLRSTYNEAALSKLTDDDELLHRQVHPSFVRDGRASSQAFRPTPKDSGRLSVDRGALRSAEESHLRYTTDLGLSSAGTWAVAVGECSACDLPVEAEPLVEPPPNPAHAAVVFTGLSRGQCEAKGTKLARAANERGCIHPPAKERVES